MSAVFDSVSGTLEQLQSEPARSRPKAKAKARVSMQPMVKMQVKARTAARLPWVVLATVLALELAVLLFPAALLLHPVQASVLFKQITGYSMLGLLGLAIAHGGLRRLPAIANHRARLNHWHQLGGLLLLLLLAAHLGQSPKGFLLYVFHAMALGLAAGSLRAVLARRVGPARSGQLLAVHIGLSCVVAAGALAHLYFIYVYTG